MKIKDLVFAGLNAHVVALDRNSGEIVWQWVSPKPRAGYVTLLLDKDRLLAAVNGYLYCLDPLTGEQMWFNPLKGFGTGVTSLATVRGSTSESVLTQAAADDAAAAAAAAAVT